MSGLLICSRRFVRELHAGKTTMVSKASRWAKGALE